MDTAMVVVTGMDFRATADTATELTAIVAAAIADVAIVGDVAQEASGCLSVSVVGLWA